MKVIDLFCGMGGFSEGFKQAGFDVVLGIDIWRDALKTFKVNQGCDTLQADIRDIGYLPECDVIIGSPPCQNFSTLNTKKDVCSGLKLVHEFERIIKLNMPKFWIWENVEGAKKFYPSAFILNSWDSGLSQRRKRMFVSNFSFFRTHYTKGKWTKTYGYDGHLRENKKGVKHTTRSGTVRTKRIRDLETNEFLSIAKVKELMGFPKGYSLSGKVTSQQKQLGNAVSPPVSKVLANAIIGIG